jgi:hypothetical protein
MDKNKVKRIEALEKRVAALEKAFEQTDNRESIVEIRLVLPEADIDGLHFNKQEVSAVFEKQDDGWYYSRDILFLSARNVEDDNTRDILTEYLCDSGIRTQIADMLGIPPTAIEIALPQKPQGIKKYHGVDWWYWIADSFYVSATHFCNSYYDGNAGGDAASAVGGCSPAFCVAEQHG